MPDPQTPLEPGKFYHIYKRGINGCDLFKETTNYEYFLRLYDKHISPVADTFAWVLMGNHFHLLVRIKEELHLTGFQNLSGVKNLSSDQLPKPPHQYFSNLFNAYTKAYNNYIERHGNLFERPFHRKHIDSPEYLMQVILYIHLNPVHHGFCDTPEDYPWSSYQTCLSERKTRPKREQVMEWFDNRDNFQHLHQQFPYSMNDYWEFH